MLAGSQLTACPGLDDVTQRGCVPQFGASRWASGMLGHYMPLCAIVGGAASEMESGSGSGHVRVRTVGQLDAVG